MTFSPSWIRAHVANTWRLFHQNRLEKHRRECHLSVRLALAAANRGWSTWSGAAADAVLGAGNPHSAFRLSHSAMLTPRYLVPFHPRELPHFFADVLLIGGGLAGVVARKSRDAMSR